MRSLFLLFFAAWASGLSARDLTLAIDTKAPPRAAFPHGAPCVGYAADPQVGDEEAVRDCRRAGAWLFRTGKADEATLAFAAQYGLRLFLVLNGNQKDVLATLNRLAESPHKDVVAGLQLGADPAGGKDPTMWRRVAEVAARKFKDVAIALPVQDLDSPILVRMEGYLAPVSHLVVDLRKVAAPYATLERIASKLNCAADKNLARLRLWAVAPGRLAGASEEEAAAPPALAWQMHWIMSALAVERTDGVFVERPYRADDFGRAMRHFWAVTRANPSRIGHGEGAVVAAVPKKAKTATVDLSMDEEDGLDMSELKEAENLGPAPVACANVAQGKKGDVEYLVFVAPPVDQEGQRVCLVVVNTTGERVKLAVDVDKKGGDVSSGFRRRLVPDAETGRMRDSTRARTGKPLTDTVESGEVTFFDFRI